MAKIAPNSTYRHLLNLTLEVVPIILFFIGSLYGIFTATALLMVGSILSLIIYYKLNGKLPVLTLFLTFLALIFGALTLIFKNEEIIKIKVTVLDILIAMIFFHAAYWKKNIMPLFPGDIAKKPSVFVILNNLWGIFFLMVAILNEIVWRHTSDKAWVYFKVFGISGLVVIFALLQIIGLLLYTLIRKRHLEKKYHKHIDDF